MTRSEIDRLRAANPVPEVGDSRDDEALFERITAQPRPGRTRHRPARRRRLVVSFAVAGAALVLLGSTAFGVSRLVVFVHADVVDNEYLAAQKQLTLPPGYTWPERHFPKNAVTSPGMGGGMAVSIDLWSWEDYLVKAVERGDTATARQAYDRLQSLLAENVIIVPNGASEDWTPPTPPDHPWVQYADDGGIEMQRAAIDKALAGDPKDLAGFVKANDPYENQEGR